MKEQLLEYLFKKSPVALSYHKVIFDKDGIPYDCEFLDVNNIYETMIGLRDSEVIGKRYNEIFKTDTIIGDEWKRAFIKAIITDKTVVIDLYNKTVSKWIRITIFILDEIHFASIFNDVSKEYIKENEIEGILKVNIDMLCVTDENLNLMKVNKEFQKVLGYSAKEFEGKNLLSFIHKEDVPKTISLIRSLNELEPISGFVNRVISKIGGYRYWEWYIQMNGRYIYASARDVTEKFMQEAKLNKMLVKDEDPGLLSIEFFNKRISEEIERADRYNDPLAMMMLALDNFKTHKVEPSIKESILKEATAITRSVIRKYDILVKIDEERFILLMPKTNKSGAIIVAEKIRKALNENINPTVGKLMASFGVSERIKAESLKQWQERLNKLLINAQEQGENFIIATKFEERLEFETDKLQWNNKWNSGNDEIDKDHKELLDLLNDLINTSLLEMDFNKSIEKLDVLIEKTVEHFQREEEILSNMGYKDYDKHSKIHKNLIGKVFQLKQCYQNRELNSAAFFSFIADDVIIGHLVSEDMQFFSLFSKS